MEKKLKQLLLVIPIFFMMFVVTDVKAADICDSESGSTSRQVNITRTNVFFSVPGVHDNAYFYMFSLDGVPALCLDAGKPLSSVKFYLKSNSPITNIYIKKAYVYAKNNSNNTGKRLVAQIVTWAARKNYTEFSLLVRQGFSNYAQLYRDVSQEDALTYLNELLSMDVSGLNLYIWEKPGSEMQNLVSEFGGNDTPCQSRCSLENVNELAICSGVSTSNYGTIYQQAVGECSMTYDSSSPEQYTYYGKLDTTTDVQLGRYCGLYRKESVTEELPGNIATAVNAGSYIVWPNNNKTSTKVNLTTYPLKLTFKREYKILVDSDTLNRNYSALKTEMRSHAPKGETPYIADRCASISQRVSTLTTDLESAQEALASCQAIQNCYLNNGGTYVGHSCNGYSNCNCYNNNSCGTESQTVSRIQRELTEATTIKTECQAYGNAYERAKSLIVEFNKCISTSISSQYGSVDVQISSNHNDRKYGGNFTLIESDKENECTDCTSGIPQLSEDPRTISVSQLLSKVDLIQSRNIVVSMTSYYDLQAGYYNYIDKEKNESVNSNYGLANFDTIPFSNMPISYDAPVGTSIPLDLNLTVSGTSFDSELSNQDYTCHYEVTNTPPPGCVCPDGTPEEGTDIECLISEYNANSSEPITCADGQVIFCESSISEQDTKCPTTCPDDPSIDLTSCINDGNSYDSCVETWCNGNPPDGPGGGSGNGETPVCPAGTTNEGMDLTSCVMPMVNKGMSYEDALEYCVDVTCPIKGIKIIYRTISLSNPFPSFDADSSITQNGLSIGMFNDTVKGRYPGSNWNSKTVVQNVILNNRGVDGDEVYNKTPLYTFVLNSQTIRAIRSYNKNTDYADFNLNCKLSDSAACVSSFVHNSSLSGLVSNISKSTCGGTLTANNFYSCADKRGVNG